jgi:hypothetical protein
MCLTEMVQENVAPGSGQWRVLQALIICGSHSARAVL